MWHRKICKSCKCSQEEHGLSSELDEDRKVGGLLSGSRYAALTARPKGGDGARIYKRNRMIVTNPNISGKDPTFDTITYEWAPPGLTQKLVRAGEFCSAVGKIVNPGLVWKTVPTAEQLGEGTECLWVYPVLLPPGPHSHPALELGIFSLQFKHNLVQIKNLF